MNVSLFCCGRVIDYHWQGPAPVEAMACQGELTEFDEWYSAVVLCAEEKGWCVFLKKMPLPDRDNHGRRMSAACFVSGLRREDAQNLLLLYLGNQNEVYKQLTSPRIFRITEDFIGNEQAACAAVQRLLRRTRPINVEGPVHPLMREAWKWLCRNELREIPGIRAVCSDVRPIITYGEADFYLTSGAFTPYTEYEEPVRNTPSDSILDKGLNEAEKWREKLGNIKIGKTKLSDIYKYFKDNLK